MLGWAVGSATPLPEFIFKLQMTSVTLDPVASSRMRHMRTDEGLGVGVVIVVARVRCHIAHDQCTRRCLETSVTLDPNAISRSRHMRLDVGLGGGIGDVVARGNFGLIGFSMHEPTA